MAQIRRAKLRCTCHGAIFERVLVRRTQEYKSIPRTTSRKSPEIAHVRRHGSLSCMPLFSPPLTPSFVAAFAALKVSFPGACPGKDDFYFDEETTSSLRIRLLECFLFVLLFRGTTGRQQNSLRLFCFLPVNLVFIVAALLSRCRCGGACPPTRRESLF